MIEPFYMFLDTWSLYLQPTFLLTSIFGLTMQSLCFGMRQLKKYITGPMQVVTNTGCTVFGHIHCVRQN